MYLRGKKKSSKEVSLYEPIGTDREGNEIQLFDVIEMNEEDVYRRLERKEDVIRLYQQAGIGIVSERTNGTEAAVTACIMKRNIHSGKLQQCSAFPDRMYQELRRVRLKN